MADIDTEREFDRVLEAQDSAEIMALRAELTTLRVMHADRVQDLEYEYARANSAEAEVERLRAALEAQDAAPSQPTPDASTATANQTYTWLPGDVWTQYCAAVEGLT